MTTVCLSHPFPPLDEAGLWEVDLLLDNLPHLIGAIPEPIRDVLRGHARHADGLVVLTALRRFVDPHRNQHTLVRLLKAPTCAGHPSAPLDGGQIGDVHELIVGLPALVGPVPAEILDVLELLSLEADGHLLMMALIGIEMACKEALA